MMTVYCEEPAQNGDGWSCTRTITVFWLTHMIKSAETVPICDLVRLKNIETVQNKQPNHLMWLVVLWHIRRYKRIMKMVIFFFKDIDCMMVIWLPKCKNSWIMLHTYLFLFSSLKKMFFSDFPFKMTHHCIISETVESPPDEPEPSTGKAWACSLSFSWFYCSMKDEHAVGRDAFLFSSKGLEHKWEEWMCIYLVEVYRV